MADRVVKVTLKANIEDYTASLARAAAQTRGLGDNVETQFRRTETNARRSGERSGGIFARGLNNGLVRNSPLIAAGVSGALAAGAPAILAGAGSLFAGIGALAAAQTVEIRRAWLNLGQEIREGAVEDAAALVPVIADMANRLGGAFQGLRPQLREAFGAVAPQIDTFTTSLINAANVAMPALVRAVEAGAPVMDGLAHVVESIGTGLADMLDTLSAHGPAAGQALAAIGDIVGSLLPIIGDLLGTGTELASVVLPPLAAVLGVVADALGAIEPILPVVAAGFAGMRIARGLDGPIKSLAQSLAEASYNGGAFGNAAGKASSAVSAMRDALPVLGTVIGLFTVGLERSNAQAEEWARAIAAGGNAADQARAQMSNFGTAMATTNSGLGGFIANMSGVAGQVGNTAHALQGARDRANDLRAEMTPLQQAQENAKVAQEAYNDAVAKYGVGSAQAAAAAHNYRNAQGEVAYQEGLTRVAIDGTTQAMIDQATQAMAAIDSSFAYRHSLDQLEDAQQALNTAIAENGPTSEQAQRAQLNLEEQSYRTALAYGQQQADLSGLSADSLEYKQIIQEQMLGELYRLRDAAGPQMRAAIDKQIQSLKDSGVQMDDTGARAGRLRDQVNSIPRYTRINVEADLGPAERSLSNFIGRHWTAIISSQVQGSGTSGSGGTNRRLASGGFVSGPGTATSDSIPALLSDGEFVVNARSAARTRPLLEAINARRFAGGGPVMRDKVTVHYGMDLSGASAGMLRARQSAGAMFMAVPGGGSAGGAARWAGLVLQALAMMGQSPALLGTVLRRMNQESGGNPNAINLWDINAQRGTPSIGLMQTIGPTFSAYHDPRTSWNIYDPLANILASMHYALSRYGSLSAAYNRAGGYALGTEFVPKTGTYQLHKSEAVLTAQQAEAYRAGLRSREVGGGSAGRGGAPEVTVNIKGAEVSGRIEVGQDGLMRLVDGRIVSALITASDRGRYNG